MSQPKRSLIDLSRANKPSLPPPDPDPAREVPEVAETVLEPVAALIEVPVAPATSPLEDPVPKPAKSRATKAATPPRAVAAQVPEAAPPAAEPTTLLGARIPVGLHRRVKLYCVERGVDMQAFARDALTRHLAALQGGENQ